MAHKIRTILLAMATALPSSALADWTGGYAGLALGTSLNSEISAEIDDIDVTLDVDNTTVAGLFGGYQVQNGEFVFGGEFALSQASEVTGDGDLNTDIDILDLKGRAGFAMDNIMFYGTAGFTRLTDDIDDDANGFSFGFGADYDLGSNFVVGAEYLARRATFEDDEFDVDINFDTFTVRGAFTF
ncbi:MAG: outer membrane beta-barrel protein [Pseudomonadota bacterium]